MKKLLFLFFAIITTFSGIAQTLTHGPIIGAVTHQSAKVFLRTSAESSVKVQLSTNINFSSIAHEVISATLASRDSSIVVQVTNLPPATAYFVRVLVNGSPSGNISKFRTFPTPGTPGNYKILGGSCIASLTDTDSSIFVRAKSENADVFIFYGDWGYPDGPTGANDVFFTNPPTSYAANYNKVLDTYKVRYSSSNSGAFLNTIPLDCVWDDHDYLNDNSGGRWASSYNINPLSGPLGKPRSVTQPEQARVNLFRGYEESFPSYPLVNDTNGIYHSFMLGNVEVFVLDLRAARTPNADALSNSGNNWFSNPPASHTIMGETQRSWLLSGLQNSTADWKIVVSSVTYNKGMKALFDSCLAIGASSVPALGQTLPVINISGTGYTMAASLADSWAGFEADRDTLYAFVKQNDIRNIFIVSGDTHNAGLDDGTNSGLPELMSANLKKANSRDARVFQDFLRYNLWNHGGSGLCENENYSITYSKVETFGRDSIRLSAVDPSGFEVAAATFYYNDTLKYSPSNIPNRMPRATDDNATVVTGNQVSIPVLSNDNDPENNPMFVVIKSLPANGTLSINPTDQSIVYTPTPGFSGTDSFVYKACDDNGTTCPSCSPATVNITVSTSAKFVNFEDSKMAFNAYPNPASEWIYFRCNDETSQLFTLDIMDPLGRVVISKTFTKNTEADVRKIQGGYYLFRITNAKGGIAATGTLNVLHH